MTLDWRGTRVLVTDVGDINRYLVEVLISAVYIRARGMVSYLRMTPFSEEKLRLTIDWVRNKLSRYHFAFYVP